MNEYPESEVQFSKHVTDMRGLRFGRLTVIEFAYITKQRSSAWLCKCTCGNTCVSRARNLRQGNSTSCGCKRQERKINSPGLVLGRNMTKLGISFNKQIVKYAHHKGYRINEDGNIISPRGRERRTDLCEGHFCTSVNITGLRHGKTGPRKIFLHLLAAYQKFGFNALKPNVWVGHLNGNRQDNRPENISIKTSRRTMSPGDIARAKELRSRGLTLKAIGKLLNVKDYTVARSCFGRAN